eukprot:scaffold1741_cov262-Pinguiococcus_pyrenoidosus.AAC.3
MLVGEVRLAKPVVADHPVRQHAGAGGPAPALGHRADAGDGVLDLDFWPLQSDSALDGGHAGTRICFEACEKNR